MSSPDSTESNEKEANIQLAFIRLVRDEPILLNKSQVPSVKTEKIAAMCRLIKAYEKAFGKAITAEQVKKKLNNMKVELKKKTDKKAPVNKKKVLKEWEEELLKLLDVEEKNAATDYTADTSVALNNQENTDELHQQEDSSSISKPVKRNALLPIKSMGEQSAPDSLETDETRKLSTSELQRLVLLEELHYVREKRQRLREASGHFFNEPTWLSDADSLYINL